jgi:hypothetical protein
MKPGARVKLPPSVAALYKIVQELQAAYPGRPFTPDGHLVGSIGEVVARETFGFELCAPSNRGHDARCPKRGDVEVKITAGKRVSLRSACNHLIVLRIVSPEWAEIVYDGPGAPVWERVSQRSKSNGQCSVALSTLAQLARGPAP